MLYLFLHSYLYQNSFFFLVFETNLEKNIYTAIDWLIGVSAYLPLEDDSGTGGCAARDPNDFR